MTSYELRDLDDVRRFLLQGLWWQRAAAPTAATVRPAIEWALQASSAGQALPPLGFIADLGQAAFSMNGEGRLNHPAPVPALPINLMRTYEDHVLGKFYADWSFARAADALRRYEGRNRARGLAFVLDRFHERSGFIGVQFSPAVLKGLMDAPPEEVLSQGWESLRQDGAHWLNERLYQSLIEAARRTAEVLGPDDVAAAEAGDALTDEGEQLALRQVRQAAAALEAALPSHQPRPVQGPRETPTRILDDSAYPVGGFSSISTRGGIESLLHSQLAYMEPDDRPDLFDVKFLRDELLYYSRDENQFMRRRRTFIFALYPDLTAARFKDADLPYQRGVLVLALLTTALRRLTVWLSADALAFEVVFVSAGEDEPLAAEQALLKTLWREPLANGTALLERLPADRVAAHCLDRARRSQCCCLAVGVDPSALEARDVEAVALKIDGSRPVFVGPDAERDVPETDEPFDAWVMALDQLLRKWV
jgi:vWA domain found in the FtsH ternary systems/N-terminal helical region fused to the FtsH ternary system vWA domain